LNPATREALFTFFAILGAGASVVTVVGGIAAALRWRRTKRQTKPPLYPQEFELFPIRFEVSVGPGNVPTVVVTLRAVNYLRRPLTLTSVRIPYLQISGMPTLSDVESPDDYDVPKQSSREVYCRRNLQDSEAEQFRSMSTNPSDQGGATLIARGFWGKGIFRRDLRYQTGANYVVFGTVRGRVDKA
jgi:hypothetical protein